MSNVSCMNMSGYVADLYSAHEHLAGLFSFMLPHVEVGGGGGGEWQQSIIPGYY